MDEQWNNALDQVEDRYLQEAAGDRRKVPVLRIAGAAAAALALVAGWTFIHHEWNAGQPLPPVILPTENSAPSPGTTNTTPLYGEATGGDYAAGEQFGLEEVPHSSGSPSTELQPPGCGNGFTGTAGVSSLMPPAEWMDLSQATRLTGLPGAEGIITEIGEDYFYFTTMDEPPLEFWVSGSIGEDWCVGDRAYILCEDAYYQQDTLRYAARLFDIYPPSWAQVAVPKKPVIYLYPETRQTIRVSLELKGQLTCTYPAYQDGWIVTAEPDGTLTDSRGLQYNYLYWEGITEQNYDFSRGFCIAGEDTAAFLEDVLPRLGLNRREANEFIVYWLPMMEGNPYNIITFQQEAYTDTAALTITPTPDSLIRVFMAWKPSENYVNLEPPSLTAPERAGFTAVEWGGAQLTP